MNWWRKRGLMIVSKASQKFLFLVFPLISGSFEPFLCYNHVCSFSFGFEGKSDQDSQDAQLRSPVVHRPVPKSAPGAVTPPHAAYRPAEVALGPPHPPHLGLQHSSQQLLARSIAAAASYPHFRPDYPGTCKNIPSLCDFLSRFHLSLFWVFCFFRVHVGCDVLNFNFGG